MYVYLVRNGTSSTYQYVNKLLKCFMKIFAALAYVILHYVMLNLSRGRYVQICMCW